MSPYNRHFQQNALPGSRLPFVSPVSARFACVQENTWDCALPTYPCVGERITHSLALRARRLAWMRMRWHRGNSLGIM